MIRIIVMALLFLLALPVTGGTLRDLYRSGTVIIESDLAINSDSLPDDMVMQGVMDFAFLPDRSILICDERRNAVFMFSENGEFKKTIGQPGQGPGDLMFPVKLAVNKAFFMIWEIGNRRFSLFAHDGTFLRHNKFSETTYIMPVKIMALRDEGFLMEYTRWDREEGTVQQVDVLQILSRDLKKGKVLLEHPLNVNKFINTGKVRMNIPQPFAPRLSWALVHPDRVILGMQDTYSLRVMDLMGKEVSRFSHEPHPVPVTEKEKAGFFERMTYQGVDKNEVMPILHRHVKFPDHKPLYTRILVDPEGNILVFPSMEEGRKTDNRFDAFTSEGKFIKRVHISGMDKPLFGLRFHEGWLWAFGRDDEDEPILVRCNWGKKVKVK